MEKARQVRTLLLEALSTQKQAKSIGIVHASEEWLMVLVARNFGRHSLVSSTQKRNPRELTASRNFKICRTASGRILKSMLTVAYFILCFGHSYLLGFFYRNHG